MVTAPLTELAERVQEARQELGRAIAIFSMMDLHHRIAQELGTPEWDIYDRLVRAQDALIAAVRAHERAVVLHDLHADADAISNPCPTLDTSDPANH